ncbi:MAG: hypothetical protein ASARMPREDX12_003604 [Alectoria sarmentosa]|nr:MAG: hypothetical protein ASARMPREDX12_003604 [Alectoria sarmentosa]
MHKKVTTLKHANLIGGRRFDRCRGKLEFQGISFRYPSRPDLKIFNDFNLIIEPGKTTAIIGPSGSGKSNLVSLIERWYEPERGRIVLEDEPITELDVFCYRSKIGLVQQDPALFNDTLFQNVANGLPLTFRKGLSPNETYDLVHNACVEAIIDGFVQSLPDGYQTRMGEGSSFLSGGQRQRVAIARALISNREILLLDEATSALDPSAENIVQTALDKLSRGRTTLVISHKLATIQKADKIVFLKDSNIVEEGDHSSLLDSNGHYAKMYNRQTFSFPATLGPEDSGENDKQPSFVGTENPIPSKSEEVSGFGAMGPPAPEFLDTKIPLLSCLAMIFREQHKVRNLFLIGCTACVAAGAVYPGQVVVFAKSVSVLNQNSRDLVLNGTFWALLWFVLAVGVCLTFMIFGTVFTITGSTIMRAYRHEYFSSMMEEDMLFFAAASSSSAALTARLLTHTQQLESLLSETSGSIIIVLVNVISSCLLSIAVAWKLALVAIFGVFPLIGLAGFLQVNLSFKSQRKNALLYEEVLRFASECVACIRTISSLTMEADVCDKFEAKLKAPISKAYHNTITTMLLFALSQSANLLGSALCFWYGGGLVAFGEIDSFQFFVIFIATVASGDAAGSFFASSKSIATAHLAANHIFNLRDRKVAADASNTESKYTPQTISTLEFRDVSFAYPNRLQSPVLQHLNLRVQRGRNIAIVGASGSGKSSITALLERFYDVDSGNILVNDNPIQSLDPRLYGSMVSLVSQETVPYWGTIEENVLVGCEENPQASHDNVIQACQDANIHDFILTLPEG